jgi:hypothetical protein
MGENSSINAGYISGSRRTRETNQENNFGRPGPLQAGTILQKIEYGIFVASIRGSIYRPGQKKTCGAYGSMVIAASTRSEAYGGYDGM